MLPHKLKEQPTISLTEPLFPNKLTAEKTAMLLLARDLPLNILVYLTRPGNKRRRRAHLLRQVPGIPFKEKIPSHEPIFNPKLQP
jgi:hypothetical protein